MRNGVRPHLRRLRRRRHRAHITLTQGSTRGCANRTNERTRQLNTQTQTRRTRVLRRQLLRPQSPCARHELHQQSREGKAEGYPRSRCLRFPPPRQRDRAPPLEHARPPRGRRSSSSPPSRRCPTGSPPGRDDDTRAVGCPNMSWAHAIGISHVTPYTSRHF